MYTYLHMCMYMYTMHIYVYTYSTLSISRKGIERKIYLCVCMVSDKKEWIHHRHFQQHEDDCKKKCQIECEATIIVKASA